MQRLLKIFVLLPLFFLAGSAYSYCELAFYITSGKSENQIWSFSDDADCSNPTTTNISPGSEYDYMNSRLGQGYNVARVFSVGGYKDAAGTIVEGIKAVLTGPERRPDVEGARQRAKVLSVLTQALKAYESRILADLQKRNDEIQKITLKTSIQLKEWDAASEQSKLAALQALANSEQQVNLSENALVLSSEAFALSQAGLNVSLEKYEQLKKGALTPEALASIQNSIDEELKNFSKTKKLDQLNGLLALIANEKNEYRKRQYHNLLSNFLDQNGLVKQWQTQIGQGFSLVSSGSDPYGVRTRNSMNLIMGSLVASLEDGASDAAIINEKTQYLRLISSADRAAAVGNGYERVRGQRLVNSGYAYAAFDTKASLSEQLKKTLLAAGAAEQFPALKDFGKVTSYESYVIVNAVNQLFSSGAISNNSQISFYARLFVDEALSKMQLRDVPGFHAAIEGIQSLTDFKKGLCDGVLIGVVNTAEGIWNLVTSPIESAKTISMALVRYDRTYVAIQRLIYDTVSDMPNWNAQQWGYFQGRLISEVGTALLGAKIIDSAADLSRIAGLSEGISAVSATAREAALEGVRYGLASADDISTFTGFAAKYAEPKQLSLTLEAGGVKSGNVKGTLTSIEASPYFVSTLGQTPKSKPLFYVQESGAAVPSSAYRYIGSDAGYLKQFLENGEIPKGNYFSFDKIDDMGEASSKLQVPHDARFRAEFDTLPYVDNMRIPNGNWGKADYLEPITKDFPAYGEGGATQVIIDKNVSVIRVIDLKTGEIVFQR